MRSRARHFAREACRDPPSDASACPGRACARGNGTCRSCQALRSARRLGTRPTTRPPARAAPRARASRARCRGGAKRGRPSAWGYEKSSWLAVLALRSLARVLVAVREDLVFPRNGRGRIAIVHLDLESVPGGKCEAGFFVRGDLR